MVDEAAARAERMRPADDGRGGGRHRAKDEFDEPVTTVDGITMPPGLSRLANMLSGIKR